MAITKAYANTILSTLFSGAYLGLSTTTPAADGTGVAEPSADAGYARAAASQGSFTAENGTIVNKNYVYFPEATSGWGTVTNLCIFDRAGSGAVLRYFGAFSEGKQIAASSVPLFRPGTLTVTVTD